MRLHHFFEDACDRTPTAVALEVHGSTLTYRDLDERANHWPTASSRAGSSPDAGSAPARAVPQTYVALLATLKAGAAFVPIDPASPPDRVEYVAEDSAVDLVLTTSELDALTCTLQRKVLRLDQPGLCAHRHALARRAFVVTAPATPRRT